AFELRTRAQTIAASTTIVASRVTRTTRARPRTPARACPPCAALATATPASRCDLLQQRVHAREAALRSFLDAVLHRRVALLGRREAHRLRQLRPVAQILELERLQVVLERLHEPLGRVDLAELALDDAEGGAEAVRAAR